MEIVYPSSTLAFVATKNGVRINGSKNLNGAVISSVNGSIENLCGFDVQFSNGEPVQMNTYNVPWSQQATAAALITELVEALMEENAAE